MASQICSATTAGVSVSGQGAQPNEALLVGVAAKRKQGSLISADSAGNWTAFVPANAGTVTVETRTYPANAVLASCTVTVP